MEILEELFLSKNRKLVDNEIKKVINDNISDLTLKNNILYHLCLDKNDITPTLEHSKRLRAYLCLLFAEEAGCNIKDVIPLATAIELLHNSTLIVDDIQDNDILRCGKEALWVKVGVADALNASYFLGLFSQSYYNLKRQSYGYYDYSLLFSKTIINLLTGQQKDINSGSVNNKSLDSYFEISKGKTGALLNMACCFGCMPFEFNNTKSDLITEFTDLLSYVYQIFDDISDLNDYILTNESKIDYSNIFYFVSSNNVLSNEKVIEIMPEIKFLQKNLSTQLFASINKMKANEIISTDKLSQLIQLIIKNK